MCFFHGYIPMLPYNALSGTRWRLDQGAIFVNGYSLFTCCNVEEIFEQVPHRASQIARILAVIKHQCSMTLF